jgi:hypothetical protein
MVEHGMFERYSENIIVRPEKVRVPGPDGKREMAIFPGYAFGADEIKIPVEKADMMQLHIGNFLSCMRTRQKPHLDVETAAHAQILINLAVESYREGRVKYWDEANWRSSDRPVQV